ncbi:MAG: formate hydrogenlyase [Veillonellaceae bacterium]|nr:formate hydrogenlyase [Veillonellaceae bacterium]
MITQALSYSLFQAVVYIIVAPGVLGTLRWFKARLQGRRGALPDQAYRDLWKLLHRKPVIPEHTSWVFLATPFIVFACYALAGMLIPIFYLPDRLNANGASGYPPVTDFLILIYLFGLARFFYGLAGMDTGSSFTRLGSGREMFIHVLTEPTLIVATYALALNFHTTNLTAIMRYRADLNVSESLANPSLWLVFVSITIVMLIEAGRIPFDNPSTHLELTMIGKAISLEYGGVYLAFIEWADAMRLTFFMTFLLNLVLPRSLASPEQPLLMLAVFILVYLVKLVLTDLVLALWEMSRAKLRLTALLPPSGIALAFSILAVFVAVVMGYFQ